MSEEHLEKTKRKLKELGFTTQAQIPRDGVYVFFSFDLVNSTQFKISHADLWPVIVTRFYDLVASEVSTRLTSAILWKYVGDEVLYYRRIHKRSDLYDILPAAYAALSSVVASLHRLYPTTRSILSVKSTVWIAEAEYLPPSSADQLRLSKRNIITSVSRLPEAKDRDFLGPDIDAGFRIAKFVERKRLIVSAHLAALLYRERSECSSIEKRLRIVSYESLKGVWNGRRYPIIWYEDDWERINQSFLYDEHFNSTTIEQIKRGTSTVDGRLESIEKIFSDLGKEGEVASLFSALDNAEAHTDDSVVEIEIPHNKYSEVHCVAVCFRADGKALVAKRPTTKKRYSDCWEFGCGQLQLGETFFDCITKSYREDFGAELETPTDLIPVATFSIDDLAERRSIPGIVFVAKVTNDKEVESKFLREKHSEIKWVGLNDVIHLSPEECVPNLESTLRVAFALLSKSQP